MTARLEFPKLGRIRRVVRMLGFPSALLSAFLLSACAESDELAASRARRLGMFEPGTPAFEFLPFPDLSDVSQRIVCALEIPHSSLVFVRSDSGYEARIEIRIRLTVVTEDVAALELSWEERIGRGEAGKEDVRNRGSGSREPAWSGFRSLSVPPGEYVVEAAVEDLSTRKRGFVRRRVLLPPPHEREPRIFPLRFVAASGAAERPLLAYHLHDGLEGLTAIAPVRNPAGIAGRQATCRLLRFVTDSLPARPPFLPTSSPGTLRWYGVDFRRADTIWSRPFQLAAESLHVLRIPLSELRGGLYELSVSCTTAALTPGGEGRALERRRVFPLFDRDFPRPLRLKTLVDPMQYLLTPDEFAELAGSKDDAGLRSRFERIWLRFGQSEEGGKNLIKIFAARVEEANRSFSGFKEGWKTDQGMVAIVFGPPALVEREFRKERWVYGTGYVFTFEQAVLPRGEGEVENWVLYRDSGYERVWEREIERWKRGDVF